MIMEYVILGFLLIRDLTQYDMKKALEMKPSPFFSASFGSIQSALKKLESKGFIIYTIKIENGREKKIYQILDSGKQAFHFWMMENVDNYHFDQIATTKLFFLGLLNKEEQLIFCAKIIKQIDEIVAGFKKIPYDSSLSENQIYFFQFKTLELGLSGYEEIRKFFLSLEKELREE